MSDTFGFDQVPFDEEAASYDWWEGAEPPDFWDTEEVVLFGMDLEGSYSIENLTAEDWFTELTQTDEYLLENYGMDHYEIIDQLEQYGLWDDDDWERYGEAHGS